MFYKIQTKIYRRHKENNAENICYSRKYTLALHHKVKH